MHAFWNGATEVARWEVLYRRGREAESAASGGIETAIDVGEYLRSVVVVARDREGRELGRSAVTPVVE